MSSHDDLRWDELAAGYALHSLEPEDEMAFNEHLTDCVRCRATLDDHALVASQLAALVDDTATNAPPWSRIRPVLGRPQPAVEPPHALRADQAPRRRSIRRIGVRPARALAAAAAFVGLVGVAVAGWQVMGRSSGGSGVPGAVAACRTSPGCHVVRLLADGKAEAGDVVVRNGSAMVVPTAMPSLDDAHVYVLWQVARDGSPTPVTVLDTVRSAHSTTPTSLAIPYGDTMAFAMSVEPADRVPTKPTKVVALGNAT